MRLGILLTGASLVVNLVPQSLAEAASRLVEAIAINSVWERKLGRRTVVLKQRNLHSKRLADLTNLYFRAANIPIRFWSKLDDWRRWEIDCFEMLNGDSCRAHASGKRCIVADKLPGETLWEHLNRGTLTKQMLRSAALELRRAHQFWSDELRGRWSHGDASITNVIYDPETNSARFIDFEICHDKSLSATARQADDLLMFLLDLVGTVPANQWLPFARTFLEAYGDRDVIGQLRTQLEPPGGLAWIWWGVRTNFSNPAEVKRRLADLNCAIPKLILHGPDGSVLGRNKRRASINCHPITPGIPIPSSRTRAIIDKAKPSSPHLDGSLPIPSKQATIT